MTFEVIYGPRADGRKDEKAEPVVSKYVQTHFLANNFVIHFKTPLNRYLFIKFQTNLLKPIVQQTKYIHPKSKTYAKSNFQLKKIGIKSVWKIKNGGKV